MPIYITLIKWTDQGRSKASSLPDRVAEVDKRIEALGGKSLGNWLTMGRFDQIAAVEAPDDETAAKLLMVVAERGNAETETLRAFTMDEVRSLLA
ncbi:MAG TPA: GYD domain-containing protein [Actinomycetota bacterium]